MPLLNGCTLEVAIDASEEITDLPSLDNTLNSSKLLRVQYPQIARVLNTSTTLPNGKILVAGGALNRSTTPTNLALSSAEIYDPETGVWSQAASLPQERLSHTATLLQNGKVLFIGGAINNVITTACLATASLYDPSTDTWSSAASLTTGRCFHTATLLPDGRVMVAGGRTENSISLVTANYISSVEIYNPTTNTWASAASMTAQRANHSAIVLKSGKVFIVGGRNTSTLVTTALYTPSSNTWAAGPSLTKSRKDHTTTLLPDGKVVIIGGMDNLTLLADTTVYDPTAGAVGSFSNGPAMPAVRKLHTATLVGNRVFVVGGGSDTSTYQDTMIYDPAANQWETFASLKSSTRYLHTANIAGKYLVILGGLPGTNYNSPVTTPEKLDISGFLWKSEASLSIARFIPTAALLKNGKVLVAGGVYTSPSLGYPVTTEIFDPVTNTWSTGADSTAPRARATATVLQNGKVLVVGGQDSANILNTTDIYDPDSNTWTAGPLLTKARSGHTATLLPNGKVLVLGGTGDFGGSIRPAEVEIYDPDTNTWSLGANMPTPCYYPSATLVPGGAGGKVVVIGGQTATYLTAAQIYDVATNTWTIGASMTTGRVAHAAVRMGGKIFVAAGYNSSSALSSVEIYDVATDTWQPGPAMTTARNSAGAATLPDGKIIVFGGQATTANVYATSEIYNPVTNTWSTDTRLLNNARGLPSVVTLEDQRILIIGGADPYNAMTSVESYRAGVAAAEEWQVPPLLPGRGAHIATLLKDGRILVTGGNEGTKIIGSTAIYNPATNQWQKGPDLSTPRQNHTATLLASGKVFIAGGSGAGGGLGYNQTADIFDPSTNTITTMPLLMERAAHSAIALPNGKVLLSGGINTTDITTKNEICDPVTGTCTASADRPNGLYDAVIPLNSDKYLFIGAYGNVTYQPSTDTWTAVVSMTAQRAYHAAIRLLSGKVMVIGGVNVLDGQTLASTEIYDPDTNTWTAGPPLDTPIQYVIANLLPSGEIVVTGGTRSDTSSDANVRVYNPETNQWALATPLKEARALHTATLLSNGHLMVYGGDNSTFGVLPFWEQVFDP
ncbi:kelch repeat-containing protein [Bdellovibrio sp. 22V]|uniref:kelch repeat-containing protein n=1 Tax=Bdellovibrio sp. 22V TaxID=3044166 RepID=UPI002542B6C7|nr:kelch repeat-containing protein [Bdellovibrio sp. 22V]WII70535.1 kelch repeat-containing protein [Bdellovibrio sp. 22V]